MNVISIWLIISWILFFRYVWHIIQFWNGWKNTPLNNVRNQDFSEFVSVIVAARNEESRIQACVESILKNDYPNFELIVIDNHSTDSTLEILQSIDDDRLRVLSNKEGFKKESLELAIAKSKGTVLLFTDADCIVPSRWIKGMMSPFAEKKADFVLGPVAIKKHQTILSQFQAIDMMAMMGITAGGLKNQSTYLANGANIAFLKSSFEKIGGYPAKHIKSGDDTMLIHEAVRQNYRLVFNKSKGCIVETFAVTRWKDLVNQRKRWASKTVSYINFKDKLIAAEVFLFIFSICINVILAPFTGGITLLVAIFQLLGKGMTDFWFLRKLNSFFLMGKVLNRFLALFVVQFYMFLWSGISGIFGMKYRWKGRDIS